MNKKPEGSETKPETFAAVEYYTNQIWTSPTLSGKGTDWTPISPKDGPFPLKSLVKIN